MPCESESCNVSAFFDKNVMLFTDKFKPAKTYFPFISKEVKRLRNRYFTLNSKITAKILVKFP